MRIVIVGGSKFGTATAEQLIEHGHEVVIIDRDRARLERLSETLDCGMIEGDGTSPSVLRDAQAGDDDVLIALTNASDDNILAALVGRSVGFGRVIPQIISPELMEVCTELDLTDTITPHATVARSLCRALEDKAEVSETLNLSRELRLKRLVVPEDWTGSGLGDLELPTSCKAIARIRDDTEVLVSQDTNLSSGDELLIAVETDAIGALEKIFDTGNL
ncbi:TrkA family potassium uptake protein [Marivita sp. S6314]|uniref:potassium channel family protein n=1 Tax=Marivita sp. S6314 TaxID=2926406 RepID=UPI001FF1F140|nr:TrkA family potassium uptake protein [Marivita sp. S6314]MCK0149496.1 TrkA family potassium uptake protein [Marivita sp. S6314]